MRQPPYNELDRQQAKGYNDVNRVTTTPASEAHGRRIICRDGKPHNFQRGMQECRRISELR